MIGRNVKWMGIVVAAMLPLGIGFGSCTAQTAQQRPLPASFDVVDADHGDQFVARIRVDGTGRITAERIDPQRREWFETVVRETNQQETIVRPIPPPSSAPRFAYSGVPVARDDPEFLTVMKLYLQRVHGLELR